ncbi:AAA-like domain-containing protein [Nostoc punctiforme FACHB-252]|uniref:AAA-like domain-containing protein n=1 Tax=Nostoc punctiforme FACHB-252 TaxID=1357509 RepID=A0ABR8HK34_NOSPU|nr:AAA-like domain-containing protein [Nostoc punctiforme]MBD2616218.1 AAA-like domain-containing protein [Nostoc punctiforme FACHB-252]
MKDSANGSYRYQVGGALGQDVPSYVTRAADRQFYEALQAQEFCYVLNSRQMGKSSLMVRTLARLKSEGWEGIVLDFSAKDSQVEQAERWYNGIINQLNRHFGLLENARTWLKERDFLSPVERLEEFLETVLLPGINQRIVIFIDEIDSTLNLPFTDDFFALIRACYNKRADNPDYKRLTFALLGVAAPAELIGDKKRTPFNIGQAINLFGFGSEEAQPLVKGLETKADNPQAVLAEILKWTGGQPFLSQRLCQLVVDNTEFISAGKEAESIEKLAHNCLIDNWESQDEQEHLKTIRNRLLSNEQKAAYLLELYRQIRQAGKLKFQNTSEERELQLSGLVVKRDNCLTVYNPIYEQVFNEQWIDAHLGKLRPYSENFRFWVASGGTDESRLLRGKALQEAEEWAKDKNLSYQDKQYLAASKEKEIQEKIAAQEQEAALERERQDKEAAEARNQLLVEANKKAKRRISVAVFVLFVAVAGSVAIGLSSRKQLYEAKEEVEAVQELNKLAGELQNYDKYSSEDPTFSSNEALRVSALSFNVNNHQLRQALVFATRSQAYQQLKKLKEAKQEIQQSQEFLNAADKKALDSSQGLQIQVLFQKTQGDFLNQNQQTSKAIESYRTAFDILRKHPKATDFTKHNQLLTGENIELVYQSLIKLDPQNKEVAPSLTKHLYAQLEYFLKAENWEAADNKTYQLMLNIAKREEERYLDRENINRFSCPDLERINKLWVKNSNNRFGFSVQKKIWISTGNRLGIKLNQWTEKDLKNYFQFVKVVGWYDDKLEDTTSQNPWISYGEIIKRIKKNSVYGKGGLPLPNYLDGNFRFLLLIRHHGKMKDAYISDTRATARCPSSLVLRLAKCSI